jgi:hypothetical protein
MGVLAGVMGWKVEPMLKTARKRGSSFYIIIVPW